MKKPESFTVGIERGRDGWELCWCFELPGCAAIVPPGGDRAGRVRLAILEFASWAHRRSADRLTLDTATIEVAQAAGLDADVVAGESLAFFLHDAEAPGPREFPAWANAHDLALDELRSFAQALPPELFSNLATPGGRTVAHVVADATEHGAWLASRLAPASAVGPPGRDPVTALRSAQGRLQEVVCDVSPDLRRRLPSPGGTTEEWSVRKIMRRSIWHLRRSLAEARCIVGSTWFAPRP